MIFGAVLLVIFVAAYFVVRNNSVKKQQPVADQKDQQQTTPKTQKELLIESVTAPVQQESTFDNSQPVVDQKIIDSISVPVTKKK